jgi:hypothetical protein
MKNEHVLTSVGNIRRLLREKRARRDPAERNVVKFEEASGSPAESEVYFQSEFNALFFRIFLKVTYFCPSLHILLKNYLISTKIFAWDLSVSSFSNPSFTTLSKEILSVTTFFTSSTPFSIILITCGKM